MTVPVPREWHWRGESPLQAQLFTALLSLEVLFTTENLGLRGMEHASHNGSCLCPYLLRRWISGGSRFEANQGKKLARPDLNP
jgi:hypothetical protein